jgi:signal transduction histidine kinase
MALFALIVDPEALLGFALWGAIGGAVFGVFLGLGRESLWTQIAGINSMIIVVTFAVAFLVLPIDFFEVGWLMGTIVIAGFGMAFVSSFFVTRPLQILAESTQAIGEQNLSERVPVEGAQEIRTLAQSFNGIAEALETAETIRQQLLVDVRHELRTPLTVLQSNLRAILDDVVDSDKDQMLTLYSQTRQLYNLVDDLHDIAQADAAQLLLEKMELDLNALIAQAGELFTPLAQEACLTLHTSTPQQTVMVLGDRNRLIQVLQNLLGNGLRHALSQVDLRLWSEGEMACVEVADDGDGIAAEDLPNIFKRFHRVETSRSRETRGAWLGLAISQAFVEAHGGRITENSEGVGKGTAVCFELPMTRQTS